MDYTSSSLSSQNCNFTCRFLSAAKSAASFQNPPQAMKTISKDMVEFVSNHWSQPWPILWPIFPEIENPKNKNKTLIMVDFATGQIIKIKWCQKLVNDVRITNMQLVFVIDARIMQIEIKNGEDPWETYNALGSLKTRGLDWFSFWRWPANDWDTCQALKWPLTLISIPHFFFVFASLVLPL